MSLINNNMVLNHQKIDLGDKCLIEKVIIQAPFRYSVHFHDEACFIYFLEGEAKINSPYEQIRIGPEESVLLIGPWAMYYGSIIWHR